MNIQMDGKTVGDGQPCFIVAEIGENHMVDLQIAYALIEQSALVGADAVKFQTATPDELYNPSSPDIDECAAAELDLDDYPAVAKAAKANNVTFFSTPFDETSADFLEGLGVPYFKIGSGELDHHNLLRHVAKKGKPMIISTGMSDLETIKAAVNVIKDAGNEQIIVTHCVSVYPAPVELANVRAIPMLREELGTLVGWSDHTQTNAAAVAAVALGACYFERHITLSRSLPEGDNSMSTEPHEFKHLVHAIREVEKALGSSHRSVLPEESVGVSAFRRGVYARTAIKRGQTIEAGMLAVRRPNIAISASEFDLVVNRQATTDIAPEEAIRWESLAN